jgi:hypothetical protein
MLPSNLNFNNSVEASASRSFRSNIQPQTGSSFKKSETIVFNIPTRNNLVMSGSESVLRGKVTFRNGGALSNYLRLDSNGAHGLFYRLQIYHGSNLIESIENYNTLTKMLYDLQVSTPQANGKYSILCGTSTEYASTPVAVETTADATAPGATYLQAEAQSARTLVNSLKANLNSLRITSKYINIGRRLNPYGTAIAANADTSFDFCLPLVSLLGTLSPKFLPLFAMKSAPLRLELQLVSDPLQAIMCDAALDTTNDMIVSDIEFIASMMELSDSAIDVIKLNTGGKPLQFTFGDWKNYRWASAVPNSVTNLSVPIPAKFASLKSLFIASKRSDTSGRLDYLPFPAEKNGLISYTFRIGPTIIPSKPPSTVSEFFSETLKAIGGISDATHAPAIDFDSYNTDVQLQSNETLAYCTNIPSPSFYVGLDLESYAGADKSQLFSGLYTANDDIFYMPILNPGAAITLIVDAFACYDSVIVFENDTAYVKY